MEKTKLSIASPHSLKRIRGLKITATLQLLHYLKDYSHYMKVDTLSDNFLWNTTQNVGHNMLNDNMT